MLHFVSLVTTKVYETACYFFQRQIQRQMSPQHIDVHLNFVLCATSLRSRNCSRLPVVNDKPTILKVQRQIHLCYRPDAANHESWSAYTPGGRFYPKPLRRSKI